MAGDRVAFPYFNKSASAVLLGSATANMNTGGPQGTLHILTVNSAAATATIQLFDDTTTSGPTNPITGLITAPAGGYTTPFSIFFDATLTKGLTLIIGVAAANVTVTAR